MRLLLISVLVFGVSLFLAGQSANELTSKRKRLLSELKKTNRELSLTREKKGAAVGQAELLRLQVEQRRELIATLEEEVTRSQTRIIRDSTVVVSLEEDLDRMKSDYGNALRVANRNRLSQGWLVFLFSADGFNEAFRRLYYLRRYREFRVRQGVAIRETSTSLSKRLVRLSVQKATQDSLLLTAVEQGDLLEEELREQNSVVANLTSSERSLLSRIERQRAQSEALGKAIENAIAESIDAEADEVASVLESSAASGIAARKGRLGWPARGKVVRAFGTQPHPEVPSVKISNSGIDIAIGGATPVAAVFAGKVISVRKIPGFQQTMMVRHGKYYTVYSNLARTSITVGSEVDAGTVLGFTAGSNRPLHFELWRGKQPLNPQRWLAD